eukprot:2032391-Rhodomonas_salina.1
MRALIVVSFVCVLAMGSPTVSASNSSSLGNLTGDDGNWIEVASAMTCATATPTARHPARNKSVLATLAFGGTGWCVRPGT